MALTSPFRDLHASIPAWALAFLGGALLWAGCSREADEPAPEPPEVRVPPFPVSHFPEALAEVDPERCRPCHEEATEAWERSQHAIANRPLIPSDESVFGRPVADEGPYEPVAGRRGLRIDGPGAEDRGMAGGVIGITPLIQYLIGGEDGRWQAHELAYDPELEEWFNIFEDQQRRPGEWGHWSGQGMNWNSNCAWCHMTDFKKNYDPVTDTYASTWLVQGVSCVQCHPRSAEHTVAAEAGRYIPADHRPNTPRVAMQACAPCHSRREELTLEGFVAGDAYHDHYRLTLPDAPGIYFPDGQNLDENYVFGSLMLSQMGHSGVTCADCHDAHSHELILPVQNNALCQRCHGSGDRDAPIIDPLAHSHHPAGSTGNQCIECHMPLRTYMARDPRRDHGFTSPDPELSRELGTPDVCTRCHQDEPVEWSIDYANQWYDTPARAERRARARLLDRAHDPMQPFPTEAIRAAAEGTDHTYWQTTWLRLLATSPEAPALREWADSWAEASEPIVRAAAVRLLGRAGAPTERLEDFLGDASRQVRIEAIEALQERGPVPPAGIADLNAHTIANADRPAGALQMASEALTAGDRTEARHHVRRATSFDPTNPLLYFQGALILSDGGNTELALEYLRGAPEAARRSGHVYYAEGLLWAEEGNFSQAAARLRLAVQRDPRQARWWYNLALAYTKMPNWAAAHQAVTEALTLEPRNPAFQQLDQIIQRQRR